MANKLNITELDYSAIKGNLRVFLQDNPVFTDYNFEGSALDILNSQLAYNTHYIGFYANMLFNEAFLDTAVKRQSVVSLAKQLNYTPKSIVAPTAVVNINVVPTGVPIDIFIPKGTVVGGKVNGTNYNFITIEDNIATPTGVGNIYRAEDVALVQGTKRTIAYVKNSKDETQRFLLPFANIDTKYLKIIIQKEESDLTNSVWEYSDTILDINGESEVYFLQEAERGRFEIYFGDGYLGKTLVHGNVVFIEYLMTDGVIANNANEFVAVDAIGGTANINYETVQVSIGGKDPEDIDFIRRHAPRFYESQKRAVTQRDYQTLLLSDVTFIRDNFDSVQVWGGEDNVPPLYGNVLVSLKPKPGAVITTFLKEQIKNELLGPNNVVGVIPIIIDPEYLWLELVVSVTYAQNKTTLTRSDIVNGVRTLLRNYRDGVLALFDKTFRLSEVSCLIADSDQAIISDLITLRVKRFEAGLLFNQIENYTIDFRNPIEPGTMRSAEFFFAELHNATTDRYFLEEDRSGNVVLKKKTLENVTSTVNSTQGTINYETGVVDLTNFAAVNLIDATAFWVSFVPAIDDLFSVRNLILTFADDDLTITARGITA